MSTVAERKLLVGLVGKGIQQSLSPAMHEEEARYHGIRLHYQLIDLDQAAAEADALPTILVAASAMGFTGLNITHPYKQTVIPVLDELSDEARATSAVNTVVFRDGKLIGHNTDGAGWRWAFRRAMPNADLSRVLLLGAGGAGSAIAHAVLRLGAKQLIVTDTEMQRAADLVKNLCVQYGSRATVSNDVAASISSASGLIHATPTGMEKFPGMPIPAELLRPELWVSEIVYFPIETALLRAARACGCVTLDGSGMAVGQAAHAFELFTGITPHAARMEKHFHRMFAGR
jgi:shikimate dehydrogenase